MVCCVWFVCGVVCVCVWCGVCVVWCVCGVCVSVVCCVAWCVAWCVSVVCVCVCVCVVCVCGDLTNSKNWTVTKLGKSFVSVLCRKLYSANIQGVTGGTDQTSGGCSLC